MGNFLPDDDLLQRPIVASEGGSGEISSCCRCEIQGFQEEGAVHLFCRQTTPGPHRVPASKAKSSVLSHLSGLEKVVFNDFIYDELDSEDVSEQRVSASLPDSVPMESEDDSEGVVCMCCCVGVCVCVCVCARARLHDVDMCS